MAILKLPSEEIGAMPGRLFEKYYTTKPFDVIQFINEIGALDGRVENAFGETERLKKPGEDVKLYDVIWAYFPGEEKRLYTVKQEIDNGYIIREDPTFLCLGCGNHNDH